LSRLQQDKKLKLKDKCFWNTYLFLWSFCNSRCSDDNSRFGWKIL